MKSQRPMAPLVSVIIPAYNATKYISQAIQSILDQTYGNFEIIIVDDGSTDDTKQVVGDFLLHSSQDIRYFFQQNGGPSSARNRGLKEARGDLLSFLDADDLWVPDFLEKMVRKIDEGFDWAVSENFRDGIDAQTGNVNRSIQRKEPYDGWDTNALLREFLIEDRIGGPGKIMVRRKALTEKNISFDNKLLVREDWDLYLNLLSKGCLPGWVHEPLLVYRIRSDNSNLTRRMKSITLYSTLYLLEKHTSLFLEKGMKYELGEHYFRLSRRFWREARDGQKSLLCLMRNVNYKGWGDIVALIKRKSTSRLET